LRKWSWCDLITKLNRATDHQPESVHKIAGQLDNDQLFLHCVQKKTPTFVFLRKSKYEKK